MAYKSAYVNFLTCLNLCVVAFAANLLNDGPTPRNGNKSDQAHPPIHPLKHTNSLQVGRSDLDAMTLSFSSTSLLFCRLLQVRLGPIRLPKEEPLRNVRARSFTSQYSSWYPTNNVQALKDADTGVNITMTTLGSTLQNANFMTEDADITVRTKINCLAV